MNKNFDKEYVEACEKLMKVCLIERLVEKYEYKHLAKAVIYSSNAQDKFLLAAWYDKLVKNGELNTVKRILLDLLKIVSKN